MQAFCLFGLLVEDEGVGYRGGKAYGAVWYLGCYGFAVCCACEGGEEGEEEEGEELHFGLFGFGLRVLGFLVMIMLFLVFLCLLILNLKGCGKI